MFSFNCSKIVRSAVENLASCPSSSSLDKAVGAVPKFAVLKPFEGPCQDAKGVRKRFGGAPPRLLNAGTEGVHFVQQNLKNTPFVVL